MRRRRLRKPLVLLSALALALGVAVATPPVLAATTTHAAAPTAPTAADPAPAAYTTSTVLLGKAQVIGALYQPTQPNPHQSTALFLTHENNDFIGSVPCVQLAQRGYTVLCVKSQYTDQATVDWDQIALDVSASVSYLRALPTVQHVVLVGWSGGGAIMSYYQNVAEHGVSVCQRAARLDPCSDDLAGMPPADGVVLLDAIPGIAFDRLIALDASVTDEKDLNRRDASLDMYSKRNGYDPDGSSDYSRAFVKRYLAAQSRRQDGLTATAERLQRQIARGTGQYSDDAPMPIGRDYAQLWQADSKLLSHTQGKYQLLSPEHPDGGTPQVVHSLRVPSASATENDSWAQAGGAYTANSYMSTTAIRAPRLDVTADSITGVDWSSTNTATVDNVQGISTPLLIMSMSGHYFLVPSEMYYKSAQATHDKTLVFVKGATHGFTPCTACATTPGEFGDTVAETFDYVSSWLDARFS
jgi:dienelactone hydrolase